MAAVGARGGHPSGRGGREPRDATTAAAAAASGRSSCRCSPSGCGRSSGTPALPSWCSLGFGLPFPARPALCPRRQAHLRGAVPPRPARGRRRAPTQGTLTTRGRQDPRRRGAPAHGRALGVCRAARRTRGRPRGHADRRPERGRHRDDRLAGAGSERSAVCSRSSARHNRQRQSSSPETTARRARSTATGGALGLPRAYSGHNAYARFGMPPGSAGPVIVLGYGDPSVDFSGCRPAATIDNGIGLENEEQGGTVFVCERPREPWSAMWDDLRHLDA